MPGPSAIRINTVRNTIEENTLTPKTPYGVVSLLGTVNANTIVTLSGADADRFELAMLSSRVYTLSLKAGQSFDYETQTRLDVIVSARDATSAPSTAVSTDFTVQIIDIDENAHPAPVQTFTPQAGSTQGAADASTAIVLDGRYMLVGDDEGNSLRVFDREGGAAVKEIFFGGYLGINNTELDLEASTRIGEKLYFIGSHGNSKSGNDANNREWLFSATASGTGADTALTFTGKFGGLEAALVQWDQSNAHNLGANHFGFAAGSASGTPESNSGFGIEGLTSSADGSALWIAFRAPVTGSPGINTALIVQLTNVDAVLAGTAAPAFGSAIELDLGGRAIRSIDKNAAGQYLVLAGPSGPNTADVADDFRLYTWDGSVDASGHATNLVRQAVDLDALLAPGASFETIVEVPSNLGAGAQIHLLQDNGDVIFAGQTEVAKDLPVGQQHFTGNVVTLGGAAAADTTGPQLLRSTPADNAVAISADADITLTFNESVRAGSGSFVLKDGNTVVATFAANAAEVKYEYNKITLETSAPLQPGRSYTLEIAPGAIVDAEGNAFAGISGESAINFDTEAPVPAGTVLAAGDIVFLAVNTDSPDAFAFALLKDVEAGTQIGFSDRDYAGSAFPTSGEAAYMWTANTSLKAGTIVTIQPDQSGSNNPIASHGTTQGKAGGLSASGETIYAFQGQIAGLANGAAGAITVDHFVAAINVGGAAAGTIPDSIAAYTQSFVAGANDNVIYKGSLAYAPADLAAAARNNANFNTSDTATAPIANNAIQFPTDVTKISAIQGSGLASTKVGQSVTVEARVTAWLPDMQMFYVQEELADHDGNAATSEGVAVFYGTNPSPVNAASIGDIVRFTSTVTEYFEMTELINVANFQVIRNGTAADLDPAVQVKLPLANAATLEQYEGMRIEVSAASGGALHASDTYTYARYGEITFYADGVAEQYTQQNLPSVSGNAAYLEFMARNSIQLDDGSTVQNPSVAALQAGGHIDRNGQPFGPDNFVRVGDTAQSLTGVLGYGFESYELHPTETVTLTPNVRETAPSAAELSVNGTPDIKVASFNVLNYFTQYSGNFNTPYGNSLEVRGANNATEFARQQAKIVEAIIGTSADVMALNEMQNNGFADGTSALDNLVDALNAKLGANVYDYIRGPYDDGDGVDEPTAGTDAIMVAIIYNKTTVKPLGQAATPDVDVYSAFGKGSRPPVAQTFSYIDDTSKQFTVVGNHFKSKGSLSSNFAGDADQGDGQGNNNPTRLEAAVDLARWIATNPTGATDGDYLLLGDFNSYASEDPMRFLTDLGFDASKIYGGYDIPTAAEALKGLYTYLGSKADHSYVFDGFVGSLDHGVASAGIMGEVTGFTHWNINSEEQIGLDYNTEYNPAGLYAVNPYRAADHDPLVIGLKLNSEEGSPTEPPPGPTDTVAPTLQASSPADNAANVAPGANITLTFNEAIKKGTGTITLKALDGAADVVLDVSNAAVSVNGSVLTINPAADLQAGKQYAVLLSAGAVEDIAGNDFAGIANNATLNFTTANAPAAPSVFITEIHYDNAGTDTGERIAVSGAAGTSLTGWSIVLYNGNGGASYNTKSLNGTVIDNEGGTGFGEVYFDYPVDGIQNGSPDGIALVNASGQVVQFLSYEGVMTANGGPANGMTSIDIGAAEGSSAPVGGSIQLIGGAGGDWQLMPTHTFGTLNADFFG